MKRNRTTTTTTKDVHKRFELPEGADPKSITGKVDAQKGILTITGKRTRITETRTITETNEKKASVLQEQSKAQVETTTTKVQEGIPATAASPATRTPINTIATPLKELINDSTTVTCQEEIINTEQGKALKVT